MPLRWRSYIPRIDAPRGFVDEQVAGPYRRWLHEHTFEAVDGGTLVRDLVDYELPLGPLGYLAHAALVARQLRDIFDYREAAVRAIFGGKD